MSKGSKRGSSAIGSPCEWSDERRSMNYRTAFITGASSGIGCALSARLAAAGVEVAIAARREDKLRDVERAILQAGGRPRVYVCDVADAEATRATLERADTEMGGLDL